MKKLLKLTTCALFMALSCIDGLALEKGATTEVRDDLLIKLIKRNQYIELLSSVINKKVKTDDGKSMLPFGDLSTKLHQKATEIANAENKISNQEPEKEADINGESMLPFGDLSTKLHQKATEIANTENKISNQEPEKEADIKTPYALYIKSLDKLFENNERVVNNQTILGIQTTKPANGELLQIGFELLYDISKFFEGLLEPKFNFTERENAFIHTVKAKDLDWMVANHRKSPEEIERESVAEEMLHKMGEKMGNIDEIPPYINMSLEEFEELTVMIYNYEMERYLNFVKENKDILEKVSEVVNNGFKIKLKKCRTIQCVSEKKEFCTSGNIEREIKSLSEILDYIKHLQANPAIEESS